MPNAKGASTHDVRSIPVGDRILILGLAGRAHVHSLPAELRADVRRVLDRLTLYPTVVEQVRHFWRPGKRYPPEPRGSDRDFVASLRRAIGAGEIEARVVTLARTHRSLDSLAQARNVRGNLTAAAARLGGAAPSNQPPAIPGRTPLPNPSSGAASQAIGQWPLGKRIEEVLRRTIAKTPGAVRAQLTAFATPDNVTLLAGGVLATSAATVGRADWRANRAVAAIGFAYAGLEAFPRLGDVHAFAARIERATSEADLNAAADALARAVSIFSPLGVAALLHRNAGEGAGGPGSDGGELADALAAATGAGPSAPRTPTPAAGLAAAKAAADRVKAAEAGLLAKAEKELAALRKQYADAVAKLRARADALLAKARAEKALLEKEEAALLAKLKQEKAALEKEEAALLAKLKQEKAALEKKLEQAQAALKKERAELEKLARELQAGRRAIGERIKALMAQAKRAEAEARNLAKYGDKLGPTIDSLKKSGKSAEQMIKSASRTGGKPLGL